MLRNQARRASDYLASNTFLMVSPSNHAQHHPAVRVKVCGHWTKYLLGRELCFCTDLQQFTLEPCLFLGLWLGEPRQKKISDWCEKQR